MPSAAHYKIQGTPSTNIHQACVAPGAIVPCKICGTAAKYILSLDSAVDPPLLDIFSCPECGLLFVGNPITNEQLTFAYNSADTGRYYQEIALATDQKMAAALHDLGPLLSRSGGNSSLLDVGCGHGHFLEALAGSYPHVRAAGHELPGESAEVCRKKNLRVFTGALDEIPERFTIVSLLDVAEHVPWPTDFFTACYALLDTSGYIYLHTPRKCFWDGLFIALAGIPGFRRLAVTWLRTRVSIFHLHLWSDKALRLSLQKAGFEIEDYRQETELSWPVRQYVEVYLGKRLSRVSWLMSLAGGVADILFVKLGTLKNKAVCRGVKR
ncbi:class I SAM-dependent methyltransferase [Candidatus Zixiibacteriota bacterium]